MRCLWTQFAAWKHFFQGEPIAAMCFIVKRQYFLRLRCFAIIVLAPIPHRMNKTCALGSSCCSQGAALRVRSSSPHTFSSVASRYTHRFVPYTATPLEHAPLVVALHLGASLLYRNARLRVRAGSPALSSSLALPVPTAGTPAELILRNPPSSQGTAGAVYKLSMSARDAFGNAAESSSGYVFQAGERAREPPLAERVLRRFGFSQCACSGRRWPRRSWTLWCT